MQSAGMTGIGRQYTLAAKLGLEQLSGSQETMSGLALRGGTESANVPC
jgi:hypothetical protein